MTFAVTGTKTSNGGSRLEITVWDTEEKARENAMNLVQRNDWTDITVWKQIGVPKLETKVSWEDSHAQ